MIEFAYSWGSDSYLTLSLGFLGVIGAFLLFVQALFGFYLAYCTLRVSHDSGRLRTLPLPVQVASYTHLGVGLVLDVLFNLTVGSIAFAEIPREPTFTQRCHRHLHNANGGWRMRLARWVCDGWLNPFEAGHC